MSFMKKKNKGDDSTAEEFKKKAFDEVYDLDTDILFVQTKRSYEAAKILKEERKNIQRKREQATSKHLSRCMDKYDKKLKDLHELQDAAELVKQHLEKRPRKIQKTTSLREPKHSQQQSESFPGFPGIEQKRIKKRVEESPRDEVSIEYSERQSAGSRNRARHSGPYQTERTGTDDDFERYERKSSASAQRNASEVLEQKVKSLEKEKGRLQHELQAEKTEKDKVFKELEDAKRETHALDDKLRDLQKHSSKEKDGLEEEIRRS